MKRALLLLSSMVLLGCGHDPPPLPVALSAVHAAADAGCLGTLRQWGVPFVALGPTRGIQTPVEITGPIGEVRLVPRVGRAAVMDCELARALAEAGPLFHRLDITGLSFSEGYDYRVRAGSRELSAHAYGLAIDVHAVETRTGRWEVEKEYAKDPQRWRAVGGSPVRACVGSPRTSQGRLLRQLACGLRAQPSVRLVLSPDDNYDHRNHLHIETFPADGRALYTTRPGPVRTRQGRRVAR